MTDDLLDLITRQVIEAATPTSAGSFLETYAAGIPSAVYRPAAGASPQLVEARRFYATALRVVEEARAVGEPWVGVQGPRLMDMAKRAITRAERAERLRHRRSSDPRRARELAAGREQLTEFLHLDPGPAVAEGDEAAVASAVIAFQRRHTLVADGVVGRQTALALNGQFEEAKRTPPGKLPPTRATGDREQDGAATVAEAVRNLMSES